MWLAGMTRGAADAGAEVQYCMASAHTVMASLEFPAVTNARVNGDGGLDARGFTANKLAACVSNRPPFLTPEEERAAEKRIEGFMADVVIPLAAQTNAIVICSATPNVCILSASLTRMYQVERAKWGSRAPFTIISATSAIQPLYCNTNEHAVWREIRKSSRSWKA